MYPTNGMVLMSQMVGFPARPPNNAAVAYPPLSNLCKPIWNIIRMELDASHSGQKEDSGVIQQSNVENMNDEPEGEE